MPSKPIRLDARDWLIVETVRRREEAAGAPIVDAAAAAAGRERGGDMGARTLARARALEGAHGLLDDIARLRRLTRWVFAGLLAIGLVSGALAARAVLAAAPGPVPVLPAIFVLVGTPSLFLIVWLAMFTALSARRTRAVGGAGRVGMRVTGWLAGRVLAGPWRRELIAAFADLYRRHGHLAFALSTHAFWLLFCAGAVLTLTLGFFGRQYDFEWGTTLLSEARITAILHALGAWPAAVFGTPLPDAELIAASREGVAAGAGREMWARYLIGLLLFWALAPRAALTALFAALWSLRGGRPLLEPALPGYIRLLPELYAESRPGGPVGPPAPEPVHPAPVRAPGAQGGPVVVVAIELGDAQHRREAFELAGWVFLGSADDRAQRRNLLAALEHMDPAPARIIALCSLARSPDRSTSGLLRELAAHAPVVVALDERTVVAARGEDPALREQDWRSLAESAGACAVVLPDADSIEPDLLARLIARVD